MCSISRGGNGLSEEAIDKEISWSILTIVICGAIYACLGFSLMAGAGLIFFFINGNLMVDNNLLREYLTLNRYAQ